MGCSLGPAVPPAGAGAVAPGVLGIEDGLEAIMGRCSVDEAGADEALEALGDRAGRVGVGALGAGLAAVDGEAGVAVGAGGVGDVGPDVEGVVFLGDHDGELGGGVLVDGPALDGAAALAGRAVARGPGIEGVEGLAFRLLAIPQDRRTREFVGALMVAHDGDPSE